MTNNATQISQVNKNEIIKSTTVTTHHLNFFSCVIQFLHGNNTLASVSPGRPTAHRIKCGYVWSTINDKHNERDRRGRGRA